MDAVDSLLPPVPVLRLTAVQQRFWDEFLTDLDFEGALARARCPRADARRAYARLVAYEEQMAFRRLAALRQLGCHLGMWGQMRKVCERGGARYPHNPELSAALLLALLEPDTDPVPRCCFAMLLDYFQPAWRSAISVEQIGPILARHDPEVLAWKKAVLRRDGRRCQRCGASKRLHVHHIAPWSLAPELRVVVSNGVTLCADCHGGQHHPSASFVSQDDVRKCPAAALPVDGQD